MADTVIRTASLTKSYGRQRGVGPDLEVRAGEVFGYLGRNGAGKTTTIRLLLDSVRPTGGSAGSSAATAIATAWPSEAGPATCPAPSILSAIAAPVAIATTAMGGATPIRGRWAASAGARARWAACSRPSAATQSQGVW